MKTLPAVLAHRGGRDWAPENTLAAFQLSVDAGVAGVEFDVHRCATGELVVIHDDDLLRTTNGAGFVKDASLDELKRISAGLWFDKSFREERIPLLTEVLDLLPDNMLTDIELKNAPIGYDGIEEDLLYVLEPYRERLNICVSSFDHHCLQRLRALDEQIEIGVLMSNSMIGTAEYCAKFQATYLIQDYYCLMPEVVREAHEAGLKIIVWTVNEQQQWQRLIDLGIYGICTDTPSDLLEYYQRFQINV